ncbi:MAG TPA: hypothetical protein VGL58_19125 [Caulobacteraceae bacterium]
MALNLWDTIHFSSRGGRRRREVVRQMTRCIPRIDAKLTVAFWAGGLLFVAILTSQTVLWVEIAHIGSQVAPIEQMLTQR